jgi:hypothetical protein
MTFLSRVTSALANITPIRPNAPYRLPIQQMPPREMYAILRAYYESTGLYDALAVALNQQGVWRESLKGLRNPAFRAVEFYPATLWPGPLGEAFALEGDNAERLRAPIETVWRWSNWAAKKQVFARHLALFGDAFLKVATTDSDTAAERRVSFQLIEPEHVTDLELDERGYIRYVRLDVPRATRGDDGKVVTSTHTEAWDRDTQVYRRWEHKKPVTESLDRLGDPAEVRAFAEFGITFIPIVHAPFRDVGQDRGVGCFTLALDKIDEANRQATRLHQMLFRNNRNTWALGAGGMDASGRPLPPPRVNSGGTDNDDDATITIGDDTFIRLPGNASLQSLVPQLQYEAALKILQDHMRELRQDIPELAYYEVTERSDLSGRALRLMLGPALQRAAEARGNAQAALVRADQMALTLGAQAGLFTDLGGTYESGAFEHGFAERDVLPVDPLDKAEQARAEGQAAQAWTAAGFPAEIAYAQVHGWDLADERLAVFTRDRLAAIRREQMMAAEDVPPMMEQ